MSIEQPQVWGDHSRRSCLFNSYIQWMGATV